MKKMIAILLCGVLAAGMLAGCGSSQSQGSVAAVTPSETVVASKPTKPSFQVGDTVLTIGESTVEDLVNAGAAFSSDSQVKTIDFSEDPLYQREMKFALGGTTITIQAKNMTESIAPIKNSVIKSVYFNGQQACGVGGVMIGDTVEQVEAKLGKAYVIINAEDYRYNQGQASMTQNTRIYGYASQFDDITVRVCIDRNTSQTTLVEEVEPANLITEPKQVDDDQIKALTKAHDAGRTGVLNAMLMDSGEKYSVSGSVTDIKYDKIKVLTIDSIRDSKKFYENRNTMYDRAVASTYLMVQYSANLVRNPGTKEETSVPVVGCFYLPNAVITDEGNIESGVANLQWKDSAGVYTSEEAMLKDLFSDASQGYSQTDFTVMERAVD